jgi:thiol:disulfide interchange protein DsbC
MHGRAIIIIVSICFSISWGLFGKEASCAEVKKAKNTAKTVKATDCSSLTKQDIRNILGKLKVPESANVSINATPVKNICEVAINNQSGMGLFYIDVSRKYLFLGNLVDITTMTNLTANRMQEIKDRKRIDTSKIPLDQALVAGEPTAPKKVIVFTDPDCDFCAQLHKTIQGIIAKRKDIVFFMKLFPLDFHKDAYWKAKSIVCNKSLKLLEENFTTKTIPKTDCTTDEIENNMKLAKSLGINATPTIILPDGRIREGAMSEDKLIDLIDGRN